MGLTSSPLVADFCCSDIVLQMRSDGQKLTLKNLFLVKLLLFSYGKCLTKII